MHIHPRRPRRLRRAPSGARRLGRAHAVERPARAAGGVPRCDHRGEVSQW